MPATITRRKTYKMTHFGQKSWAVPVLHQLDQFGDPSASLGLLVSPVVHVELEEGTQMNGEGFALLLPLI